MFEEPNSEAPSSMSEDDQGHEDANDPEAQLHGAQVEFMQRYVLTSQDHQTIENAQPKPKKRRAAHGSEAQNNGGQNSMDAPLSCGCGGCGEQQ